MIRIAIIILPLALAVAGCELEEPKDKGAIKQTAKTVKAARGLCKVEATLRGVLAAADTAEVRLSPQTWAGPFTIRKLVDHGAAVKKGDILLELDPTRLDQSLRDIETETRITELAIRQAEAELPALEKLVPIDLAEAERLKKQAIEDRERFLKIDRAQFEESARQMVASVTHWLEYAREELKQLQKMYRDKDLTEETEEIILKRQKDQVERSEFALKSAKLELAEVLEVILPRKEIAVRETARKLTIANDKAQAAIPLLVSQKKLALARLKQDLDRSRDQLAKLKHDRALMTVLAPADGLVFYGRGAHGQFGFEGHNPMVQRLVVGGNLSPEEVFMTVVTPRPALVYATVDEKDLNQFKPPQACKVTPTGYPDLKLAGKLKSVESVRQATGGFLATISLDEPAEGDLRPAMNCTVKVPVYQKVDALLLPTSAIQHEEADEDQSFVNLATSPGKTIKRTVKVGKTMGNKSEILEGLKEGDEVLAGKPEEK